MLVMAVGDMAVVGLCMPPMARGEGNPCIGGEATPPPFSDNPANLVEMLEFVALRESCAVFPAMSFFAYATGSFSSLPVSSSTASSPMTDLPETRCRSSGCPMGDCGENMSWKEDGALGVGSSPLLVGALLPVFPLVIFPGGEIRSSIWNAPLYREDCRVVCPLEEPLEESELTLPRPYVLSRVFRRGP